MSAIPFTIHSNDEQTLPLAGAILLYQLGQQVCATVHRIGMEGETPTLLPGCAVTSDAVNELARALGQRCPPPRFLPLELLWHERQQLLWWLPPGQRPTLFRVEAFGRERSGNLPHPGLVFYAAPGRWMVWAVKGKQRPRPATPLWRAPYLNTYRDGQICAGSSILPAHFAAERLEDWNAAFFSSAFSHLADSEALLRYQGGPGTFWLHMLDGAFARFPQQVLCPSIQGTLDQLLTKLTGVQHEPT